MGWIKYLLFLGLITNHAYGQTREERLANNRLPGDLRPYHYDLEIRADLYDAGPNKTYDGTVNVYFLCVDATNEVYVNIRDYTPTLITVSLAPENNVTAPDPRISGSQADLDREFFIVTLTDNLVPGARYRAQFVVDTFLRQDNRGLFQLSYESRPGRETRYIAATYFDRSNARAAFPCFDEPEYFATYDVTILRRIQYRSISSMQLSRSEQRPNDWIADVFARTPPAAPGFLGLAIFDFQYRERVNERGIVSRIWSRADQLDYTGRAWSIATALLDWFENYTGIAYPLMKIDHVALPGGPGGKAWGLNTYPEDVLLWSDTESDMSQLINIYISLAHETSHQWFGGLVSPAWWNDIWLNEGTATLFGVEPYANLLNWNTRRLHSTYTTRIAIRASQFVTQPPIVVPINTPQEVDMIRNPIQYVKGGALLIMIKYAVGEATFQRFIQRFLNKRQYSVATTDDFWTDLQEQVDADNVLEPDGRTRLDVKEKFDAWARQEGCPLVTFDRETEFGVLANLNQTRFVMYMDTDTNQTSPWGYKWQVPITIYHEDEPQRTRDTKYYMPPDGLDITSGLPPLNKLMVSNVDRVGLYRVMYDNTTLNQLLSTFGNRVTAIPSENRAGLIEDMFRVARAFRTDETPAMEFTRYLNRENQWVVWRNVVEHINFYDLMFMRDATFEFQEKYWRTKVDPVYERNRFVRPTDIERRMLRRLVTYWSCMYNNQQCVDRAMAAFNNWWQNPITRPIEPDQHMNYMCVAVRTGEEREWNIVYALYRAFASYRTTDRYLIAMTCSRDYYLLERYFTAMEDGTIPSPLGAIYLGLNPLGMEIVWRHLKDNWTNSTFGDYKRAMLFAQALPRNRPEELVEFEDFVADHPPVNEQEERTYERVRGRMTANVQWMLLNEQPITEWLQRQVSDSSKDSSARSYASGGGGGLLTLTFDLLLEEARMSKSWSDQPTPDQLIDVMMQLNPYKHF